MDSITPAAEPTVGQGDLAVQPVETAVDAAVAADNTSAFREARRAERAGKPLEPPTTDPAKVETAKPAPQLSREQRRINEAAEYAVTRATETLRQENAALKKQLEAAPKPAAVVPAVAAPPATPAPVASTVPDWKRIAAMPNAPRLTDVGADGQPVFDTIADHSAAMSVFVNETLAREAAESTQRRTQYDELTASRGAQIDSFVKQLNDAKAADPEFVSKLSEDVKHTLKPFDALPPAKNPDGTLKFFPNGDVVREGAGPRNIIGEEVYKSPVAPALLRHFSDHPEDLARLEAIPAQIAAMPKTLQPGAHIAWMVKELGKIEAQFETGAPLAAASSPKQLTDAPPASPVLGQRPAAAVDAKARAIQKGDTTAFREIRRQEAAAGRH